MQESEAVTHVGILAGRAEEHAEAVVGAAYSMFELYTCVYIIRMYIYIYIHTHTYIRMYIACVNFVYIYIYIYMVCLNTHMCLYGVALEVAGRGDVPAEFLRRAVCVLFAVQCVFVAARHGTRSGRGDQTI